MIPFQRALWGGLSLLLSGCAAHSASGHLRIDPTSRRSILTLSEGGRGLTFLIKEHGRLVAPERLGSVWTDARSEQGEYVRDGLSVLDIVSSGPRPLWVPKVEIALERSDDGSLIMIQRQGVYTKKVTAVRPGQRYWITVHANCHDTAAQDDKGREVESEPCLIQME